MRIEFEHEETGEVAFAAGGSWDKRFDSFEGEADQRVVVRFHPGQAAAVEWFATWIAAHVERRESPPEFSISQLETMELDVDRAHVYSSLFAGGRRGGKTWIACAMAVAYSIMFPKAIVWIVSPNDQKHDEIRRYLNDFIASLWLEQQTLWDYEFVNGSAIHLKSAHGTGGGLKEGMANFVILNEGQMMQARAFTVSRGAIVDKSGLVLVCANPPTEAKDQLWVSDFAAEAAAGRRAAVFIEFNPLLNPHIDRVALLALRAEVDERTFEVEVLGFFRGPPDAVCYNWLRLQNELSAPPVISGVPQLFGSQRHFGEITDYLMHELEEGDGITAVAGVDFQRFPYIGGPIYRFFGSLERDSRENYSKIIAWITDEVVLDGGDEEEYCRALAAKGYRPENTLIVGDASGRYQHTRRSRFDQPPPTWSGRGSFDIIRSAGFPRIVPPSRHLKANPFVADRMRAFTSMVSTSFGLRRLFCDPVRAPRTAAAIRDWRQVHGAPSRTQEAAHLGDGASYPIVRFFPRVLRSDKPGSVDPVANLVDLVKPDVTEPDRIIPLLRGPTFGGRGSRLRGM